MQVSDSSNLTLSGTVKKVSPLADSSNFWSSGGVKEYTSYVVMDELPGVELRPGMTAEVEIEVGKYPDVVLVPTQAVTQKGRDHYAFKRIGDKFEPQKVKVGESNHKYVQVLEGLEPGSDVALNAYSRAIAQFGKESLTDDEEEKEKEKSDVKTVSAPAVSAPAVAAPAGVAPTGG